MKARILLTLALAVTAAVAVAQEKIAPEVFLDAAVGRTLTFALFPSGEVVGVEEFLRRDLSVWREAGRGCVYGDVSVEDGQICFQYDDEDLPICWVPFSDGERFFFATGAPGPVEMQEVVAITDKTLDCPVKPGV